jgi:hypothetical protein
MATAANPFDIKTGGTLTSGTETTAAQFAPQERQVNAATETTSGQLNTLMQEDNPLMQMARAQAKQGMAQRGLVNSSMAQGAGVAAMLEKATPIAQSNAVTYANQALTNQQAVNVGGQFNAGEQNEFGLQTGQQKFTAAQNLLNQNFTSAQAQLDRAQQTALADKSIGAQEALQKAQQKFDQAENALNRSQQTALQESSQTFTAGQQTAQQNFTKAQNDLDRAQQIALTDKSITAQANLQTAQQNFTKAENELDRTQQTSLATAQQNFTQAQNNLDRAQQIALTDKSITAQANLQTAQLEFTKAENVLDRSQQTTLQTGQQTFAAAQSALDRTQQNTILAAQQAFTTAQNNLDRAQQVSLTDKSIAAQANLQTAQQDFTKAQNALDRSQQTTLQDDAQASRLAELGLQLADNQKNIPATFAANIANTTMAGVNAITADGTLTPDAKKGAIANLITYANSQISWANTFYKSTIPEIKKPA